MCLGRPAWYNATGEIKEAFVIGICGGSASGKTTVAQRIVEKLNVPWVTLLCMDSFYKVSRTEANVQCIVGIRFFRMNNTSKQTRTITTSTIPKHSISI